MIKPLQINLIIINICTLNNFLLWNIVLLPTNKNLCN
jgi:hypothetical protein